MILTRFDPCKGITTTVAKGTAQEIADHVAQFASGNGIKWFDHIVERGKEPIQHSIQPGTLKAGIEAGIITGFHVSDNNEPSDTDGYYTVIDPDAPVEPTYSKRK